MAKRLKQRVGELIKAHGLTYSKFARKTGIGMNTARGLCENPYYNLTGTTLYKAAEFFGVEPGELVIEEDEENPVESHIPVVKTPSDSEFLNRLLQFFIPNSMLEQVKRVAPTGLIAFINEAIAMRLETISSQQIELPEPIQQALVAAAGDKVNEWIVAAIAEKLEREANSGVLDKDNLVGKQSRISSAELMYA